MTHCGYHHHDHSKTKILINQSISSMDGHGRQCIGWLVGWMLSVVVFSGRGVCVLTTNTIFFILLLLLNMLVVDKCAVCTCAGCLHVKFYSKHCTHFKKIIIHKSSKTKGVFVFIFAAVWEKHNTRTRTRTLTPERVCTMLVCVCVCVCV